MSFFGGSSTPAVAKSFWFLTCFPRKPNLYFRQTTTGYKHEISLEPKQNQKTSPLLSWVVKKQNKTSFSASLWMCVGAGKSEKQNLGYKKKKKKVFELQEHKWRIKSLTASQPSFCCSLAAVPIVFPGLTIQVFFSDAAGMNSLQPSRSGALRTHTLLPLCIFL